MIGEREGLRAASASDVQDREAGDITEARLLGGHSSTRSSESGSCRACS